MSDLSSLLTSSRQLTAHIPRPDLPAINLGLDQIEQQSRRLVAAQSTAPDPAKASYLLAQAQIDTSTLGSQIANLNTQATFAPLQPIHDTDIAGFLRHAHEQSLVASIEEGRRETEAEFYRVLDERVRRDWESRKKRIFEELGVKLDAQDRNVDLGVSSNVFGRSKLMSSRSGKGLGVGVNVPASQMRQSMPMHQKMMVYDRVLTQLNTARLAQTAFPLISQFKTAAMDTPHASGLGKQFAETLEILLDIVSEQPQLPYAHAQAHLLNNSPVLERSYAKAYLGEPGSSSTRELRIKIVTGARTALEKQYWQYLEQVIQSKPVDAALGGDPSLANRVRGFLSVKYYKGGKWQGGIEHIAWKPLWAQMFYLIRTGHREEALEVALAFQKQLEDREPNFVAALRSWVESPDGRQVIPRHIREHMFTSYNSHIAFDPDVDPFKQALFKLIARIEPNKKTVPLVTATTEDWIWFQLTMVDEQEGSGLTELAEVLESYGEKHFGSSPDVGSPAASTNMTSSIVGMNAALSSAAKKITWARLLLICGLFEKAVMALYEHPELQIEAIHLAIALSYYGLLRVPSRDEMTDVDILIQPTNRPVTLNFALLISRYIRQFQKTDPKEALQYAFCVALGSDRVTSTSTEHEKAVSQDQLELARELVRRVIIGCDGKWEELVGGVREDGTKYGGILERYLPLLRLDSTTDYNEVILKSAAAMCEGDRKLLDAIKLYNLAGARDTVLSCLARALGELLSEQGGGGREGKELEVLAQNVLRAYELRGERTRDAQDVIKLIKLRSAMEKHASGDLDAALEDIEAADVIPLEGDVRTITRKVDDLRVKDQPITGSMAEILLLTMNVLHGLHARVKAPGFGKEVERQAYLTKLRKRARAVMTFATMQPINLSADVINQLTKLDVAISQ
ncbi:hypothetical protein FRB99_007366 [Tulasnella sp. 403]|nr:hypothetical protein FRB99_007366 [Tulasnella sp. 403]